MPDAPAPAVEGWFSSGDEPALIGSRCSSCGTTHFPKETFACRNPACAGTDLAEVPLSRTGTIWSYTVNHYPPPPPGLADGPYGVAAVHLADEHLVVLGRIADGADLDALAVGQQVELVTEPIVPGAEETTWKWRPL